MFRVSVVCLFHTQYEWFSCVHVWKTQGCSLGSSSATPAGDSRPAADGLSLAAASLHLTPSPLIPPSPLHQTREVINKTSVLTSPTQRSRQNAAACLVRQKSLFPSLCLLFTREADVGRSVLTLKLGHRNITDFCAQSCPKVKSGSILFIFLCDGVLSTGAFE